MVGTSERFKDADFLSSWMSRPFSILIPIPNSSTNIGALIQPMSTEEFDLTIKNFTKLKFHRSIFELIRACYTGAILKTSKFQLFIFTFH